jgi:hypothetical protein
MVRREIFRPAAFRSTLSTISQAVDARPFRDHLSHQTAIRGQGGQNNRFGHSAVATTLDFRVLHRASRPYTDNPKAWRSKS